MTAAQIKAELRKLGLRAVVEKTMGTMEYLVEDAETGDVLASGWCAGKTIDALKSAYEDALRLRGTAA